MGSSITPSESATVESTSLTLLGSLKAGGTAAPEWARFDALYRPLLARWARSRGFPPQDADDLTQIVLIKLLDELPRYEPRPGGSFRSWLFRLTVNAAHDYRRRVATRHLPAPDGLSGVGHDSPLAEMEEAEYLRELCRRGLELIRPEFSAQAMAAFVGSKVDGRPAADVATELGITVNAVYIAVNRVMTRLREVLAGLMD